MSLSLTQFVAENFAKTVKMDLARWLELNPPPVICERKWDGIRVFLFKSNHKVVLASKYGRVFTPGQNPELFSTIPNFDKSGVIDKLILDCEFKAPKELSVFDVLQIGSKDVRTLPLQERKKLLAKLLRGTGLEVQWFYAHSYDEIIRRKDEMVAKGYEGIVVKNPMSTYGQPNSWLKLKKFDTLDCFVTDYEETQEMKRTGIPHSWFVGVYDKKGEVVNLGRVGTYLKSVDPSSVKIGTVIEVKYQELTKDSQLRAPHIIRIRNDKLPTECTLSQVTGTNV